MDNLVVKVELTDSRPLEDYDKLGHCSRGSRGRPSEF